jgi:hypothetical protein
MLRVERNPARQSRREAEQGIFAMSDFKLSSFDTMSFITTATRTHHNADSEWQTRPETTARGWGEHDFAQ